MSSAVKGQQTLVSEFVHIVGDNFKSVVAARQRPDVLMRDFVLIAAEIWQAAPALNCREKPYSLGRSRKRCASGEMLAGIQEFKGHDPAFSVKIQHNAVGNLFALNHRRIGEAHV
jgi:hypothetical protein